MSINVPWRLTMCCAPIPSRVLVKGWRSASPARSFCSSTCGGDVHVSQEEPMSTSLADLLKLQQRDGFPDLVGTEIAATIPVSERLVSEAVSGLIPQGGRVQDVRITVQDGNQLTAHIRLSGPSFLPAIPVKVSIEDQPLL